MLQITPQMQILVAVEPANFRRGIDELVRRCKDTPGQDPFAGTVFVFRNRRGTARRLNCRSTTARSFGFVESAFLRDHFAGGHPRRFRTPDRSPWRLINCRVCSQPAVRIARLQHRTVVRTAHFADVAVSERLKPAIDVRVKTGH